MNTICVPLTTEAMELLDTNECPSSLLESTTLTKEEYQELLKSGVLESINDALGKIIDEYEDEFINTPEELDKTLNILKTYLRPENSKTLNKLIKLIKLNVLVINKTQDYFSSFNTHLISATRLLESAVQGEQKEAIFCST